MSLADAIIAMAKSLGLALIDEGVEYSAQISYLRQQACDTAQGFLFSEPCNAAQMQRLLDEESFAHLLAAAPPIEKSYCNLALDILAQRPKQLAFRREFRAP